MKSYLPHRMSEHGAESLLFVDKMENPWNQLCCAVCRRSDKILAEVHVKRYYDPGTCFFMFLCIDFLCLWIRRKILGTSYGVCR